jgi:hypothetical protein
VGETDLILMPLIMVSSFFALFLFYYLPLETALPIYIVILMLAGFYYVVMFKSMRAKTKIGLEAMIVGEAPPPYRGYPALFKFLPLAEPSPYRVSAAPSHLIVTELVFILSGKPMLVRTNG